MPKKGFVIAIDGPVASGKGTIASRLAKDLKGWHLNSGLIYRSIALYCIINKVDLNNQQAVENQLKNIEIKLEEDQVLLNGEDVGFRIKDTDTTNGASIIGRYKKVRQFSDLIQKGKVGELVERGQNVVVDGRDAGSVFPDATLKIYLTAMEKVRAMRRMEQMLNDQIDLEDALEELKKRDDRDQKRSESPLPTNPEELGYFVVDSSDLDEAETLDLIKTEIEKRKLL